MIKKYWLLAVLPIVMLLLFVRTYADESADGVLELVERITFDSLEPGEKYYIGMTNSDKMEVTPTTEGLLFTKTGSVAMGTDYAIIGVMFEQPVSGSSDYFIEYRYKQALDDGDARVTLGPYTMPETITEGVTSTFAYSAIRTALYNPSTGVRGTIKEVIPSNKNQSERLGYIVNPAIKSVDVYKERTKINQTQYQFRYSAVTTLTGVRFKMSGNIPTGNYFLIEGIDIYRLNRQRFNDDVDSLSHSEITKTMPERLDLPTTLPNGSTVSWSGGEGNISLETGEITYPLSGYKKVRLTATCSINGGLLTQTKDFILTLSSPQSDFISADSTAMASESLENWQVLSSLDGSIILGENKLVFTRSRDGNAIKARKYFVNYDFNQRYQLSGQSVIVDMTLSAENVSSAGIVLYDATDKKITELGIADDGESEQFFLRYFSEKERTEEPLILYRPYPSSEIINVKLIVDTNANTVRCFVEGEELNPLGGGEMYTIDVVENISYIEVSATETLKSGMTQNEFALYDLSLGIEEEDEEKRNQIIVKNDYENFDFLQVSSEQPNKITTSLNLIGQGHLGSHISWLSSDEAVLSPQSGEVVRQEANRDITVTAVFTKGSFSMEKLMEVCVLRSSTEGNLALGKAVSANMLSINPTQTLTDGNFLEGWESAYFTPEKHLTIDLGESMPISAVLLYEMQINGKYPVRKGTVGVSEDNKSWFQIDEFGNIGERKELNFAPIFARYVRIMVSEKDGNNVGFYEIEVTYNPTDNQIVKADASHLTLQSDYVVTGNLVLPLEGAFGSTIVWISSTPSVISNLGIVAHPQKDTVVTLTATIKAGQYSEQRTFKFFVGGEEKAPSLGSKANGGLSGGGVAVQLQKEETETTKPEQPIFDDVSEERWSYQYISSLAKEHILSGYETGLFFPQKAVTREEFIKMLIEALKIPLSHSEQSTYEDVGQGAWYAAYVNTAVQNHIIKGISDNLFGSGKEITREDMAVMCVRALSAAGKTLEAVTDFEIKDADNVSHYAEKDVDILVKAGIISGDQRGNFNPKNSLTREEAAKIIFKIYQ